jgi:hydroxyethylthiazole kinase-like uncharacterized protein yjeF
MPVPVLTVAQMREWEQSSWEAGCSQADVIARVGQKIGQRVVEITAENDRILILAGKGHNGDDARCAALHLGSRKVQILNITSPADSLEQLAAALKSRPKLIIDGLFGVGLNRPLDTGWVEVLEAVNEANLPVLAVDVPSGLDAESGETHGVALHATITLTIGAPKIGLLKANASSFVGRLEIVTDVGLKEREFSSDLQWTQKRDFEMFPPARRVDSHKGVYGHLSIVSGSAGYHGAAVLAARGALRSMAGLVSLFCEPKVFLPIASQLQAAMVHEWGPGKSLPENTSAILIGPGLASKDLGAEWKAFANEQWQSFPMPVIIDASALDWIQPGATPLNSRRVITPHPGEAARMLGTKSAVIQENRMEAVRELSRKFGNCWVVLKGHQTLIGRSSGEIYVNSSGNPFMAQGGSGDVLAGYLAGLLAQPKLQATPLKTIRYAVWQHGATADFLSGRFKTWTIEGLVRTIGSI